LFGLWAAKALLLSPVRATPAAAVSRNFRLDNAGGLSFIF